MRILEATIAVMLVSGVLVVVYSKQVDRGVAPADYFFSLQRQILEDVSSNSKLRLAILNTYDDNDPEDGNFSQIDEFISEKVPYAFGYSLKICNLSDPCKMNNDDYIATVGKDVFVEDIVISSELGDGENRVYTKGRKLRFYIWEGVRCIPTTSCEIIAAGVDCGLDAGDDSCGRDCGLGTNDDVCGVGESCGDAGTCIVEAEPDCIVDGDCGGAGETCEAGVCEVVAPEPDCVIDADCAAGESCIADVCVVEPEAIDPNLVAWFKFDGDTNDFLGTYDGVPSGGPEYTTGINNQALSFDKVDDYVTVGSNEPVSESEGSVSLWVYPREHDRNQILFMGGENTAGGETSYVREYLISLRASGNTLKAGWREDAANDEDRALSDEILPLNTWTHVVSTWSLSDGPSGAVKLYIDGSLQSTDDVFTGNNKDGWVNELKIGKAMDGAVLPRYFNGYLDELQIYNKPLSEAEAQDLYYSSQGFCYQESANVATSCGGLSAGSYSCDGACGNIMDGDWETYTDVSGTNILYVNYTKPTGALSSSVWKVGTYFNVVGGNQIETLDVSTCLGGDNLELRITGESSAYLSSSSFECLKSDETWEMLSEYTGETYSKYYYPAEEAMVWKF